MMLNDRSWRVRIDVKRAELSCYRIAAIAHNHKQVDAIPSYLRRLDSGSSATLLRSGYIRKKSSLRPTSSRTKTAIFSMLGPPGVSNLRGLELYAGTGNIGLEMLKRGAHSVHFVEQHHKRARELISAVKALGFEPRARVMRSDALVALKSLIGDSYDIVFADPPYDTRPFEPIVCALQRLQLLRPDARIILEHSSRLKLPDTLAGAVAVRKRVYGDSAITIYTLPAND